MFVHVRVQNENTWYEMESKSGDHNNHVNILQQLSSNKVDSKTSSDPSSQLRPKLTSLDTALKHFLTADGGGITAWITHQGENQQQQQQEQTESPSSVSVSSSTPQELQQTHQQQQQHVAPMRQKFTVLLHEMVLFERFQETYQQMLRTEAYATWYYIDQLACFVVNLKDLKRKELLAKARTKQIAVQRRTLEAEELSVRSTLEGSFLQELRLTGRTMNAKRSLLSTTEYKSQKERVTRQLDALLGNALKGI